MPFKFPYTNFQELNLDWIIKKVKDLSKQIEDDSSIVSEYIDRLLAVEDKADNAEATATAADARSTGANTTANSALTLATQAKQTAEIADLSTTLLGLKIGDLSRLFTTAKDTVVNAINEVWSIFHNATAVTNVTPAGTDPSVTYSNGVFTFDLPEGGDPDAVTHAELDAAIDDVEDSIDALSNRVDGLEEELDDKADAIINTVSGGIASFPDGTATPLKSLIVNVEPMQSGTGDPSPSNVRPISGWTGCVVYRTGANVWDEEWEAGGISSVDGTPSFSNAIRSKNFISVKPNTQYYWTFSIVNELTQLRVHFYDINKNWISSNSGSHIFTTPNNCYFIKFNTGTAFPSIYPSPTNGYISINYPETNHEYHAFDGDSYILTWEDEAGTVYGCAVTVNEDGSVVLSVKWKEVDANSLTWTQRANVPSGFVATVPDRMSDIKANLKCSKLKTFTSFPSSSSTGLYKNTNIQLVANVAGFTALAEWEALIANDCQIAYDLATPIEIQLTPQQIEALKGYNNIWSDAGSVEVTYKADTKEYIDKLIAQAQALALGG